MASEIVDNSPDMAVGVYIKQEIDLPEHREYEEHTATLPGPIKVEANLIQDVVIKEEIDVNDGIFIEEKTDEENSDDRTINFHSVYIKEEIDLPEMENEEDFNDMFEMEDEEWNDCTASEFATFAEKSQSCVIPSKSRERYVQIYDWFLKWKNQSKTDEEHFSENVLLAYFGELSATKKPSTLWTVYSMLRCMLKLKHDVDISKYSLLLSFIKGKSQSYHPEEIKIFNEEQIVKFLEEAPDNKYLLEKVAIVLGLLGACRPNELKSLTMSQFEKIDDIYLVHLHKGTIENKRNRTFTISDKCFLNIINKYIQLRPKKSTTDCFFLKIVKGKCINLPIGINTMYKFPKVIAEYLKLPQPEQYRGHSFIRKPSMANAVAEMITKKNRGNYTSTAVAKECAGNSVEHKKRIEWLIGYKYETAQPTSSAITRSLLKPTVTLPTSSLDFSPESDSSSSPSDSSSTRDHPPSSPTTVASKSQALDIKSEESDEPQRKKLRERKRHQIVQSEREASDGEPLELESDSEGSDEPQRKKLRGRKRHADPIVESESEASDGEPVPKRKTLIGRKRQASRSNYFNVGINFNEKRVFCIFCKTFQTQFARHVKRKHRVEKEVRDALVAGSKIWRSFISSLSKKGRFYYNIRLLEKGEGGGIIVCRAFDGPDKEAKATDYVSCAYCYGFYKITNLKRHLKTCLEAIEENTPEDLQVASCYSLMPIFEKKNQISDIFMKNIIFKINNDLRNTIMGDEILLLLGQRLYSKYNMSRELYIRETLRKLAYLLLEIRNEKKKELNVLQILNVDFFDDVSKASLKLAGGNAEENFLERPSFVLKIGYALLKTIEVAKSLCIRTRNLENLSEIEKFESLMKSDWNIYVCSKAYDSIKENKLNKPDDLPEPEDVTKLENFLQEKLNVPFDKSYVQLMTLILCALATYNFRRPGEPSKITVESFNQALENTDNLDYMVEEEELRPAKDVKVVRVRGEKDKIDCPVIIKPMVIDAIKRLITLRQAANVTNNPYLFALPETESSKKSAYDAVREVVEMADNEVNFKNKSLLTCTKLRKYFTTILQLSNFTDSEKQIVRDHMIYSESTTNLYRKKLNAIEKTQIVNLLDAVHSQGVSGVRNKQFSDFKKKKISFTADNEPKL